MHASIIFFSKREIESVAEMTSPQLADRDQAEIRRSAEEARKVALTPGDVQRYLDPPPDTPYPLEYAFRLLGNVRGKVVLDFGCGTGENIVPLSKRGAQVTGLDISAELIALAQRRLKDAAVDATLKVGSAYHTGLPDESVDVIFCIALIHHLDIPLVRDEMRRILVKGGLIILSEPIRFSAAYNCVRKLLPAKEEDISDHEHPLTHEELTTFTQNFVVEGMRYFRLPLVPLIEWAMPPRLVDWGKVFRTDRWILQNVGLSQRYATIATMRLRKAV
jgi:SAM-dependent methyltransferase